MTQHLVAPLCIALLLAAGPATAEVAPEGAAFEEFERARRFFEAEDFLSAARHFEAAHRLVPSASNLFNIGRCYELAEQPALAAQFYREFLDAGGGRPERRREVRERLEGLSPLIAWVRVTTDPEGAIIRAAGREAGHAPVTIALPPGRHQVEADFGGQRVTMVVRPAAGDDFEVTVRRGLSGAGAEGATVAPAPDGGEGEEDPEDVPVDRSGGRLQPAWFWGALGTTLASAVALAVVGALALTLDAEYRGLDRDDPVEGERYLELREQAPHWIWGTTGLWISTGLLAAAAVIVGIFTDWSRLNGALHSETMTDRPTVSA